MLIVYHGCGYQEFVAFCIYILLKESYPLLKFQIICVDPSLGAEKFSRRFIFSSSPANDLVLQTVTEFFDHIKCFENEAELVVECMKKIPTTFDHVFLFDVASHAKHVDVVENILKSRPSMDIHIFSVSCHCYHTWEVNSEIADYKEFIHTKLLGSNTDTHIFKFVTGIRAIDTIYLKRQDMFKETIKSKSKYNLRETKSRVKAIEKRRTAPRNPYITHRLENFDFE